MLKAINAVLNTYIGVILLCCTDCSYPNLFKSWLSIFSVIVEYLQPFNYNCWDIITKLHILWKSCFEYIHHTCVHTLTDCMNSLRAKLCISLQQLWILWTKMPIMTIILYRWFKKYFGGIRITLLQIYLIKSKYFS